MLFDVRGKRRRVIQVVYACLAILMGGSLVLFGIGSDAPGGILDGLGITDSGGATDPRYEQEIEAAEEQLTRNPNDSEALLALARYHALTAQTGISTDPETGTREIGADARAEVDAAFDAWQRYLGSNPDPPDPDMAVNIAQLHEFMFSDALQRGDAAEGLSLAEDAARAYAIAAREDGSPVEFGGLARFRYLSGEGAKGKRALERAIALTDPDEREGIRQALDERTREARQLHRELQRVVEAGDSGTGAIDDPFGGLGGETAPGGGLPGGQPPGGG